MPKLRVFILPAGFSGCAWWRIRKPIEKLRKLGTDLEIILSNEVPYSQLLESCYTSDLCILQAPGSVEATHQINQFHANGKPILSDYDDVSFDLLPSNPRYRDLGTEEVTATANVNGEVKKGFYWKTGINEFWPEWNKLKREGGIYAIKNSDAITTTTPYIANEFKKQGTKKVIILPNSVDLDYYKIIERPSSLKDQIRVGWFGGDSHREDLEMLVPVFLNLLDKYKNIKLVLKVPHPWPKLSELPQDRVEYYGWSELECHPLALSCQFWDIGVCPLIDTYFNYCKSDIKWQEFAAIYVPSVCSDLPPYQTVVEGKTGMLAKTEEDWIKKISILIENEDLRKQIGKEAYLDCFKNHNLDVNCRLWENCYKNEIYSSKPLYRTGRPVETGPCK